MSTPFSTQASNFMDGLQGGVDARTGQFIVSLPIANLVGNGGLGPTFSAGLQYSPFDADNFGYGIGFTLGYSYYDYANRVLVLSSGERYNITDVGNTVTVVQKKLDSFRFVKTDSSYRIIWKNGNVEELDGPQSAYSIKVPLRFYNAAGQWLAFRWEYVATRPRILQVYDGANITLLTATYNSTISTTFNLWPGQSEGFSLVLRFSNNNLTQVDNYAVTPALSWTLGYYPVGGWNPITSITYPTGLKETATYSAGIMAFPAGAGLAALPAVGRHVMTPGAGQAYTETVYTYSTTNYLGYGSSVSWSRDRDNLFGVLTGYTYWSRQTVYNGAVTSTTTRTYNHFHLQISEETQREGTWLTTSTEYYAQQGIPFEQQPTQFQLPRRQTTTWRNAAGVSRSETTLSEFDGYGNPTRTETPDGTVTTMTYYPPAGEGTYCPADPWGFTRFLNTETVTPPASAFDNVTRRKVHRYAALSALAGAPAGYAVLLYTTYLYNNNVLATYTSYVYLNTPSDGRTHGRQSQINEQHYPGGGDSYPSAVTYSYALSGVYLTTTSYFSGYDGNTATTVRVLSMLSGKVTSQTDALGNVAQAEYDNLGRLTRHIQNPGTSYQQISTFVYSLQVVSGGVSVSTTTTDPSGNGTRSYFDGLGRVVRQEANDIDTGGAAWYNTQTASYNAFGERVGESITDYPKSGTLASITRTAVITYDGWGNVASVAYNDGVTEVISDDPIYLRRTRTRQGTVGGQTLLAGWLLTTYDVRGLPLTLTRQRRDGTTLSQTQRWYDGNGRLRQARDEMGHYTGYNYDGFDRVVSQTLPDGNVLTKTYSVLSAEAWIATIAVAGIGLGQQVFDGLGRVTQRTSGGRTHRMTYSGASPDPSLITLPDGQTQHYEYTAPLGNAISRVYTNVNSTNQTFSWNSLTGQMTRAAVSNGDLNTWSYNPSGQLGSETIRHGSAGATRSAGHAWSLLGNRTRYTDVAGGQSLYQYNSYGQLASVDDTALNATLSYDALGRLTTRVTQDKTSANSCTLRLSYDEFDREISRTVTDNTGATLALTQSFYANDQLYSRQTLRNGGVLRQEYWYYDTRNRLGNYTCTGSAPPVDAYGQAIASQTFAYDALNNLRTCDTTFPGGSDRATFYYTNGADATQLSYLTHSHGAYPARITLSYDANGQMSVDEAGRRLYYDALNRLTTVTDAGGNNTYRYDALNRLTAQTVVGRGDHALFYNNDVLVNELLPGQTTPSRLIKLDGTSLGVNDGTLKLTGTDQTDSVLWTKAANGATTLPRYTPWGYSAEAQAPMPGFNGERTDPVSGAQNLGNGYRAYNPILMRFNRPDDWSPFGAGGINAYVYCAGDPVNNSDPSGHLSTSGIIGILGAVLGLLAAIPTLGASLGASSVALTAFYGALFAAELASAATGIASAALEEKDPETSATLGWVSLGLGVLSVAGAGSLAKNGFNKLSKIPQKARLEISTPSYANQAIKQSGIASGRQRTYQKTLLNPDVVLHHGKVKSNRLIITSHGQEVERNYNVQLPKGMNIDFYSRRYQILPDPGLENVAARRAKPIASERVTSYGITPNYALQGYSHDYGNLIKRIVENYNVDVLNINLIKQTNNNMFTRPKVYLDDILEALELNNLRYENIDAVFCRNVPGLEVEYF